MLRYWFWFLIRWFSRYQLLGFTWLLAVVVICFEGVAGLGLPALFWCRTWYGNIVIGAAVAGFSRSAASSVFYSITRRST